MDDKQRPKVGQAETENRYFNTTDLKRVSPETGRTGKAKAQNSAIASYLDSVGESGLAGRLFRCRETVYEFARLGGVVHRSDPETICELPRLCQCCGLAHSSKLFALYKPVLDSVLSDQTLEAHFATLTVQDDESLPGALSKLDLALDRWQYNFRNRGRRRNALEFCVGGVWSIEIKRGKNSGLWHPHCHGVLFFRGRPDYNALRVLWNSSTDQASASNCFKWIRRLPDGKFNAKAVCEIFKYSIKFQDLAPVDQYEAYCITKGKNLLRRFGILRGVSLGESASGETRELLRAVKTWDYSQNCYLRQELTTTVIHDFVHETPITE